MSNPKTDILPNRTNRPTYGLSGLVSSNNDGDNNEDALMLAIRAILPRLDLSRLHILYLRKSNARAEAEHANFLRFQERLYDLILEAGVPKDLLIVLSEDIGISGIYDETYRPDLKRIKELIKNGMLGTIWTVDVARITRDPTLVISSHLAINLKNSRVKIVHFENSMPEILDMSTEVGYDQFIGKAIHAAKQRTNLRKVTVTQRQEAFKVGEWTGSPLPIGWVLEPAHHDIYKGRKIAVAARPKVYEPHASVKRRVMEIGTRREITLWIDLFKAVRDEGLCIEPFPKELQDYMSTRSALKNCVRKGEVYDPSKTTQITKAMLYNLLLEPLAMGYRLFGSGARAGGKEWQQLDKRYARMIHGDDIKPDSLIRDYRVFGGIDPALALFDIEDEAHQELFWSLQEKWSEFDAEIMRQSNFETCTLKTDRKKRGRPPGTGTSNPWVGRLICGLHDDESHLLSYHPGIRAGRSPTPRWTCWKDKRQEVTGTLPSIGNTDWCVTIGSDGGIDVVTKALEDHFLGRFKSILDHQNREMEESSPKSSRDEEIESLQKEIEGHQNRLTKKRRELSKNQDRWEAEEWAESDMEEEESRFTQEQIVPVERALQGAKKRLRVFMDETSAESRVNLAPTEMLRVAETIIRDWPTWKPQLKQTIISGLIHKVTVIADKSPVSDDVWIELVWTGGITDYIVCWKNPSLDNRPFTPAEDAVLLNLWHNGSSWSDITAELLPGRRYLLVRKRAAEIGIKNPGLSREWREAAMEASKSYGHRHPDLSLLANVDGVWKASKKDGSVEELTYLPVELTIPERFSDSLSVASKEESTNIPDTQPDPLL
jgi:hypothetical protein